MDLLGLLVVAGGLQDDEEGAVVVLELRALVGALGVLDRELVQVEALGDLVQLLGGRLEEAEPDELAGLIAADARRRRLERQLAFVLALAVLVVGAVEIIGRWLRGPFPAGFRFRPRGQAPAEAVLGSARA